MRKVHVNGVEWEYEVGKRVVVLYPTTGKNVVVNFEQLFGKERWNRWEGYINDEDYDGSYRIAVKPSDVKKYILENFK